MDAEVVKEELSRIFTKNRPSRRASVTRISVLKQMSGLKVVSHKIYGTNTWAVLDCGVFPDIMSANIMKSLSLSRTKSYKVIAVADELSCPTYGALKGLPVSFGELLVQMDFLAVHGSPFDLIVGTPTVEELKAKIDLGQQIVRLSTKEGNIEIPLQPDFRKLRNGLSRTDSAKFTSDSDIAPLSSSTCEDEEESAGDDLVFWTLDGSASPSPQRQDTTSSEI